MRVQQEFDGNSCAVRFVHCIKAVVLKILDAVQMDQQTQISWLPFIVNTDARLPDLFW
jgi:hypothetical protein